MKAIVYTKYGTPDELKLQELPKPAPRDHEVLIKVNAASINSWDWDNLRGQPFINRLIFGLLKPKTRILGCDIAGLVEAVGKNVKRLQPGDEVFGDMSGCHWGGFADYVCADEKVLALKPTSINFEHAAAIPQAGVLALQGLRDHGKIRQGQKVLINGAGGGVGTFAIQLAKMYGAEVTGVDKGEKFKIIKSLGADHVIDYTRENFTQNGQQYDIILDVMGYHSIFEYRRSLSPIGIYAMVGGGPSLIFQALFLGPLISLIDAKKLRAVMHKPKKEDLDYLAELVVAGKLKPVIDRGYPLSETAEAMRYFGGGQVQGKVVIKV